MYQTSQIEYYKLYNATVDDFVDYFYSKEELIKFIAKWFKEINWVDAGKEIINTFIKETATHKNELFQYNKLYGYTKVYILYDNYDRIINIHDFEEDALKFYIEGKVKPWSVFDLSRWKRHLKISKYNRWRKPKHHYEYRKDPVPYVRKIRGGPMWSSPHTFQIMKMYDNPEYKEYNRGSKGMIPSWWDDRNRRVQKSWKEQSKVRHQWQKNF